MSEVLVIIPIFLIRFLVKISVIFEILIYFFSEKWYNVLCVSKTLLLTAYYRFGGFI